MIKLEEYSRNELKKMAADKGVVDYHNLNKAALIKILNGMMAKREVVAGSQGAKDIVQRGINLSHKAMQWKEYLNRVNISAEAFLHRFPEHAERQYIEELIVKPATNETDETGA